MKRYTFYLTDKEVEFIKEQSEQQELAASDYLRRIIDKGMNKANTSKKNQSLTEDLKRFNGYNIEQ